MSVGGIFFEGVVNKLQRMEVFVKRLLVLCCFFAVLGSTGCAKMSGQYYLKHHKYKSGIKALSCDVQDNSEDAVSAYYVGRFYLALKKPAEAQPYIEKAVRLEPENTEYLFWSGINYWALKQSGDERSAYKKVLEFDPDHISANLYLAHSYLEDGRLSKAFVLYEKVIRLDKYNPEALYHRANILGRQGEKDEAIKAWKKFLEYYPDGSLAMSGTEKLNLLGDFSYRNFIFGKRNVTLKSIKFKPGSTSSDVESKSSLHVISAMMENDAGLRFHIVAYVKGNVALAKARAKIIRDYILSGHPDFDPARMPLSWFGSAEEVIRGGRAFKLDESIQYITVVN